MGVRIGALWTKEDKDGIRYLSGELNIDTGLNIPAGHKMGVALKKNEAKADNAKAPDFFIEVWNYKDGAAGTGAPF